jgi:valyl-tRNA synthetase
MADGSGEGQRLTAKLAQPRWETRFEQELFDQWKKESLYKFDSKSGKKIFSVDTPPVYPSGTWHIGAVAHYAAIDMIARTQRMRGHEVLFPFCLDRNGINIELVVEKKHKKRLKEFERQEFLDLCRMEINKISTDIVKLAKKIGMSAEFDDPQQYYETDSPEYRRITQATFIEAWNRGLVYEDFRPSYYCPDCGTTIAEAEIFYEEKPTTLNDVKFIVEETGEELIIATTRPELLCACRAILYHPDDERYKRLDGKHAKIPLYDRAVVITAHSAAQMEFGTGIMMICSYGDQTDIQLFRELALEPISAIDERARMTEAAGKYRGLSVKQAREAIIEDLKGAGLLSKQVTISHRTPICERSKTPIEFIPMKEWYLKQLDFLGRIREAADEMSFHPARHKQILSDWIDAVTIDWPISRRRYYHTEIPIWYCKSCGKAIVPPPGKYYQPWKEAPPFKECPCGGKEFAGEERVFDTWMDSSISALYVTGYIRDKELFAKAFPCSIRPQGRDIVRTWLYYTTLRIGQLLDSKPFEHVWISGMGLDQFGKKMSKSKGNVVDPEAILNKYGAEAFRFWSASEVNIGEDFRISEDRISGNAKFLTKLWNVARFISMFEVREECSELAPTDKWILAELNELVKACSQGYDDLNFFVPATKVRDFVWNTFAPHYIEMVKHRAYKGDPSSFFTLHQVLRDVLRLLAPICPFITDRIYRDIYGTSVHRESLPAAKAEWDMADMPTNAILEFNSQVWKQKKDAGLSLNSEFKAEVPATLGPFREDLRAMHRLA